MFIEVIVTFWGILWVNLQDYLFMNLEQNCIILGFEIHVHNLIFVNRYSITIVINSLSFTGNSIYGVIF